jgi:hypothetical protein
MKRDQDRDLEIRGQTQFRVANTHLTGHKQKACVATPRTLFQLQRASAPRPDQRNVLVVQPAGKEGVTDRNRACRKRVGKAQGVQEHSCRIFGKEYILSRAKHGSAEKKWVCAVLINSFCMTKESTNV